MDDESNAKEASYVAREIQRIKSATIEAAEKRDRLPQPLFWSLFHSALKEVRDAKKRKRDLADLLEP